MSDVVWQALIAAWVTITLAVVNLWTARNVAKKTEEVKETLAANTSHTDGKLDSLASMVEETHRTTESTHILVNSGESARLKITMIAMKRVAELTGNADDQAAADVAIEAYLEHEKKQAAADTRVASLQGKKASAQ